MNLSKSSLTPSPQITFIRIAFNPVTMKASPSPQRIDILRTVSRVRRSTGLMYGLLLQLLGKLTAASSVIPLRVLSLCPFQIWVNNLGLDPSAHQNRVVQISSLCLHHLKPWENREYLGSGVPLSSLPSHREIVETDASLSSWGAVWNHMTEASAHKCVGTA